MIIGLSGKAGSGKDTLLAHLQANGYKFQRLSFATPLRKVCSILTGIPEATWEDRAFKETYQPLLGMTGRGYLVAVGTDCLRNHLDPQVWLKALQRSLEPGKSYMITDVRFTNEADFIREELGGYLIRINRPGLETGSNVTEVEMDLYPRFDATILNGASLEHFLERGEATVRSLIELHERKNQPIHELE